MDRSVLRLGGVSSEKPGSCVIRDVTRGETPLGFCVVLDGFEPTRLKRLSRSLEGFEID